MPVKGKIAKRITDAEHHEIDWILIRAVPNLVTGEAINIGILAKRGGRWEMLVGDYTARLRALGTPLGNQRAIETEIRELTEAVESGKAVNCRHLHKAPSKLLVRTDDEGWPETLLNEMVPG